MVFNENQNAFHDRGRKFKKCHIGSLEMLKFLSHIRNYTMENQKKKKKNTFPKDASDLFCGQKHSNTIVQITDYGHPMKA